MVPSEGSCTRFHEVQRAPWSVARVGILALAVLLWVGMVHWVAKGAPGGAGDVGLNVLFFVLLGVLAPLANLSRRIEIRVTDEELDLRHLAIFDKRRRRVPREEIDGVEVTRVHPFLDRMIWATHRRDREGVRLRLRGGEVLYLSTARAGDLARALRAPAVAPSVGAAG